MEKEAKSPSQKHTCNSQTTKKYSHIIQTLQFILGKVPRERFVVDRVQVVLLFGRFLLAKASGDFGAVVGTQPEFYVRIGLANDIGILEIGNLFEFDRQNAHRLPKKKRY